MVNRQPNIVLIITDQQRYDSDPAHATKKHELLTVLLDWRIRSGCRPHSQ